MHQTTANGKAEPAGLGGDRNLPLSRDLGGRGFVTLAPEYPPFGEHQADPVALGY